MNRFASLVLVVLLLSSGAWADAAKANPTVGQSKEGSWDVRLDSFGTSKIQCIKVVREATGLGLKEAKDLVEATPVTVKKGVTKEVAEALVKQLESVGGKAQALLQKS